jgi:RHS repeat-associated protein
MPRSTGTQTRTFNYDLTTARLTSVTNPETGTTSFEYNDDGSLFRKTDAKGQKIKFTYDSLGRVTVKQTYKSDGTEDLCGKSTNYWDTRPSGVGGTGWENVSGRLMAVRWSASSCPGSQFTEGYQYDTGLPTIKRLYTPTLGNNSYIDASFTYTDQGQLQSMAYPVWHGSGGLQWPETGKTFTYNLDTLSRPIGLTDESQTALVSGVTYGGPSGQLSALSYSGYNETRLYNVRGQLTRLTATGDGLPSVDLEYRFSATNNDGRITQMEDWVSSEEVNYQYDSLGRLTLAETTGPQWGQSFSYDGFGNLTDETATKGTAPTVHRNYDPATNRLTLDYTYDANGNMTAMPGLGMTYNVENRLIQATSNLNGTESYGYDAAGLRLWKKGPDLVTHVFYNGLNGKPLADFYYSTQDQQVEGGDPMVYFAGKRVDNGSVEDRLGTAVVENGQDRMAYFPYGELRSGTSTEVQFATYKRDSVTNLDYAAHRYYSTQIGRFTTPDPKASSAKLGVPQSWNRYSYALGDPVNLTDPNGEDWIDETGANPWFGIGGISIPYDSPMNMSPFSERYVNHTPEVPAYLAEPSGGGARFRFHWSGSHLASSFTRTVGRFTSNCVRYNCGSTWWRRQLLVSVARIAPVRPPCALPTNSEFLRFSTTRFISRSLTLLSIGTAPSRENTFSSSHCPST